MLEFVVIVFWIGGLVPAYRHARNNECGKFGSIIQAISWPCDVGWVLADKYCEEHKL
jgi:hypothetical protein